MAKTGAWIVSNKIYRVIIESALDETDAINQAEDWLSTKTNELCDLSKLSAKRTIIIGNNK